jgi:gluconokinase
VKIVYLESSFEVLATRLKTREEHYMKADLLLSQLDTLEEPEDAIIIDASQPLELIVRQIKNHLMCG